MPWSTPTLKDTRRMVRDNVTAMVQGAAMVGNNVLRVICDATAGMARLVLEYLDWLAKQIMVDTAETEWLDRHGQIWLVNADGSKGRKQPTLAFGTVTVTGTEGAVVPAYSVLVSDNNLSYETLQLTYVGTGPTNVPVRALDGGPDGNLDPGDNIAFDSAPPGVDDAAVVVNVTGGAPEENDDDLRTRVLLRIQQPPMGGDKTDYIQWTLAVPGVTRAWSYPLEMGIGTVSVRFMMDDLRADNDGFPLPPDVDVVRAYLDTVRPVAVKDFFVVAPLPYPIDHIIYGLDPDTPATREELTLNLRKMFDLRTKPSQAWYRAWSEEAVSETANVFSFDLALAADGGTGRHVNMPAPGYMATLGNITYLAA